MTMANVGPQAAGNQAPAQTPTMGRIVHAHCVGKFGPVVCPAIITSVKGSLISVRVFGETLKTGWESKALTNVELRDGGTPHNAQDEFCVWPPRA